MSQKTARKGVPEEKEKRQTDSPVKEMKKKMAANAEKEKQAATAEKSEAQPEKSADKQEKTTKQAEKPVEKTPEKSKEDKKVEKSDKAEKDKKSEKPAEKKEAEKPKEDKAEKSAKKKQNGHGDAPSANGAGLNGTDSELNGTDVELNGRVSDEDEEHEDDELFPELTYDDSEDSFEPPTPDGPSRSFTRRSQAKATRTPETPRPASAKHESADDSKESKVLKMKDDPLATDRKLRSADSPKPESKKDKTDKKEETQEKKGDTHEKKGDTQEKKEDAQEKKDAVNKSEESKKEEGKEEKGDKKENEKNKEKMEVEVVIEVDVEEGARKPDTNFSKSRVKVSPYRRSMRLADQTTSSVMANYTGNNTTMEMDITETSSFMGEEPSLDDSYLSGLRSIRGRRSYKPLKEMTLRSVVNKSIRSTSSATASELPSRPTGTVVGRKRKPDADDGIELATDAADADVAHGKRMRLLDRIAQPFRRTTVSNTNVSRRAAEIVGINTDLPLSAPVGPDDTFDPETLKPAVVVPPPVLPTHSTDRDAKRCTIM